MVLEQRQSTPDGSGGYAVEWQALGTLWADVRARTGREDFIAGQPVPRVRYRILVRATPVGAPSRPCPEQRLREGNRIFNILTVAEHDAGGRFLEIDAEEGVAP
jgi:SPP1 family predicted phage head-tail adaptor